jgi:hypothetical protein
MSLIFDPKELTESQLISSTVINKILVFAKDAIVNDKNIKNLTRVFIIA